MFVASKKKNACKEYAYALKHKQNQNRDFRILVSVFLWLLLNFGCRVISNTSKVLNHLKKLVLHQFRYLMCFRSMTSGNFKMFWAVLSTQFQTPTVLTSLILGTFEFSVLGHCEFSGNSRYVSNLQPLPTTQCDPVQ